MKKNEIKKEEVQEEVVLSEKQELEVVYKYLKDRGYNSIGDIENKLAKL